jgi:putative transposase
MIFYILWDDNPIEKMADLFMGKYSHRPKRLQTHDYGSECWYMITINTLHRKKYLGSIVTSDPGPTLLPTPMTHIAMDCWNQIPIHYPFVMIDTFVIMPDHVHGIIKILNTTKSKSSLNSFGTQKQNLASVIAGFKSSVKRFANKNGHEFNWQRRYHDRIIYTEEQLNNCRSYVLKNVTARDRSGSPPSG